MTPTIVLEYTCCKNLQNTTLATTDRIPRVTKDLSSGITADNGHAVETIDESEGFMTSGHIDSEDSSAPRRKCISLNKERPDCFNVPFEVFSVSSLSTSEKKALKRRLRKELEQVQVLEKIYIARSVNGVAVSTTDDASRKKQLEPDKIKNKNAVLLKQCRQLLSRLLQHPYAWVFKQPVDAVKLNIPDYYNVIKRPMDLGTIKSKLASGMYSGPSAFASDVRLTFSNARTYNPPSNDVHLMAKDMSNFFESKWKSIERKILATETHVSRDSRHMKPSHLKKRKTLRNQASVIRVDANIPRSITGTTNRRMSVEEKQKLSRRLESLIPELPDHIIEFLKKNSNEQGQINEDEIEIDINALDDSILFELQTLLDDFCSRKKLKQQMNADHDEIEVLSGAGINKSPNLPFKGNENPVDEEVDIMGNDHPISYYPPVEIEKDKTLENSKYSSSSHSACESSSSSNESDSSASSSSKSQAAEAALSRTNKVKGTTGSVPIVAHKMDNMLDQSCRVGSDSEPPDERGDLSAAVSAGPDFRPQEGNAPPERQVSPEKLYRAALLRSRFADTILKAREKTLDKAEKGNPEKLQQERKELERQQQEERVRLQAEAKMAEELRLQVEARAAAEAKRKRELEREAARRALLEMEKNVKIGENSRFLDIQHLSNSVARTSPNLVLNDGFELGGTGNPLEQLGLYMKVDEDEDDEGEGDEVEPEEGEIGGPSPSLKST